MIRIRGSNYVSDDPKTGTLGLWDFGLTKKNPDFAETGLMLMLMLMLVIVIVIGRQSSRFSTVGEAASFPCN
jgi:hypothetical protein